VRLGGVGKLIVQNVKRPLSWALSAVKHRKQVFRSLGSLLWPVFPARAFTICWRRDLPHSRIEVAFGRDWNL
jgi:hypothetical protein